jgi:hypothetical protein
MEVIMQSRQWKKRLMVILSTIVLFLGIGFASLTMTGCWWEEDDEECLVWGENCSQQYKEDNYGTTSIGCCEGHCRDHGSGILTCGS